MAIATACALYTFVKEMPRPRGEGRETVLPPAAAPSAAPPGIAALERRVHELERRVHELEERERTRERIDGEWRGRLLARIARILERLQIKEDAGGDGRGSLG